MSSLAEFEKKLGDENEETRHAAVQELAALGLQALPLLDRALGDGSWRVRKAALETLLEIPGEEKIAIILRGIRDEESANRRNTCMEALIRIGAEALPHIAGLLDDEDSDVRKFGVDIIGSIDDVKVFQPLIEALSDAEDNVAAAAAEYLGKKKHRPATPALMKRIEKGDFWVRFSCLRALGEIGDPSAGPAILALAGESDLRKVALESLGRIGTPEAEPLFLESLFSKDRGLKKIAVEASARLIERRKREGGEYKAFMAHIQKNTDAETIAYLTGLISQEDSELSRAAITLLGPAAGKEAIDPLLSLIEGLSDEGQEFVTDTLADLSQDGLRALQPSLSDDRSIVRRCVAKVLGRCRFKEAVPRLVGLLEDEDGHVRSAAAGALGNIGDQIAIAPLVALLGDQYPDVRQSGIRALCALGGGGDEERELVLNFLDPHLSAENEDLVAGALKVIAFFGSGEVMSRLKFALKDERSLVRRAAVEAIDAADRPEAVEVLRLALTDEDAAVRREAVQRLGRCRKTDVLPLILPMLQDDDLWVRVRAVQAIGIEPGEEAQSAILQTIREEKAGPVRLAAIKAVGEAKIERGRSLLMELARSADREARMAAIEGIGFFRGPEASEALLACLDDEDWGLRSAAVKALAASVGEEEVRSRLKAAAREDSDPLVRKAAADVLGIPPV